MKDRTLLISTVWPEPRSSAAGVRDIGILDWLQKLGHEVHLASPSQPPTHEPAYSDFETLKSRFPLHSIRANDSEFDDLLLQLKPDWVIFDRMIMEEQFGWRVRRNLPSARTILDTQDLHSLRRLRQEKVQSGKVMKESDLALSLEIFSASGRWQDDFLREIASILRCDQTWVVSRAERDFLRSYVPGGRSRVHFFPIVSRTSSVQERMKGRDLGRGLPKELRRQSVAWIGNFRHEPNRDALGFLLDLWPGILPRLSEPVELEIYGAYPDKKWGERCSSMSHVSLLGPCDEALETLTQCQALLAPMRFGAGAKGKLIDAATAGTPFLTTSMGIEGMLHSRSILSQWGLPVWGSRLEVEQAWAQAVDQLLNSAEKWMEIRDEGWKQVGQFHLLETFLQSTDQRELLQALEHPRDFPYFPALLEREGMRSLEYFSRWIELKEKSK